VTWVKACMIFSVECKSPLPNVERPAVKSTDTTVEFGGAGRCNRLFVSFVALW
jgi:hypothetical protein